MADKLTMGVAGVGHFGKFHANKVAGSARAELVAVADSDAATVAEVAATHSAIGYNDYRDMLGHIDAVTVAVPTRAHFEVASFFLEAGVHVLLEKPIADNLDDAARLIALAEKKNLVFQIGHLPRFSGAAEFLRQRLENPLFIESLRIAPFKPRGTDVSVILDLMIHDLDFILSLVQAPIASIDAAGAPVFSDSEDIANARVKFANGCIANITASRISLKTERQMRIFQPDAYIAVDFDKRKTRIVAKKSAGPIGGLADVDMEEQSYEEVDELEREVEAFIAAVQGGTPPAVSGEDGRRALEAALTVTDSLRANLEIMQAGGG
ncbi:MAG: Gfo/Idh/MocA family oxidoreductase [Rhodospirillaceae bacterium]|nr:Gfo/Idh/MocA family oxidoreductase [Rhodospirillaceae bacterium]MBT4427230.1 Gfo/Idh/MocA family oxidoreductase [Rhodospirillaceae bacterium]MBT5037254.1 Gfo/Idh/MocA family oxidoreductase [Rhodospirillaceae bacterium]MBT6830860.1 Gfo/Idh/MocA family oxidoreductase [Rhodospirillaceae bacterium]